MGSWMNVLLAASGYNLRKLLRWLADRPAVLLCLFWRLWNDAMPTAQPSRPHSSSDSQFFRANYRPI
jgi:hypothetical protein